MTNRVAVVLITIAVAGGLIAVGGVLSTVDLGGLDGGSVEVRADHATMHLDRIGRPTVVGEVVNGRSEALARVSVEVTYLEDGEEVESVTGSVVATPVPPGERMPFSIRADDVAEDPDDFRVEVVDVEPADEGSYDGFEITEHRVLERSQDQVLFSGEVENRGQQAGEVLVVATFYDEDRAVIGVRQVRPSPATLEPGESAAFSVRFRTLGNVPSRARAFADAQFRAVKIG